MQVVGVVERAPYTADWAPTISAPKGGQRTQMFQGQLPTTSTSPYHH